MFVCLYVHICGGPVEIVFWFILGEAHQLMFCCGLIGSKHRALSQYCVVWVLLLDNS